MKNGKQSASPEKGQPALSEESKQANGSREQSFAPLETAAAAADKLPFRKNKKAAVKMQQEKKDLKADLSRIRASVGEAAAGAEAEKERKAEILKNMDPAEQERIIREVLKEFLS